ncbi:hypothetical protein IWX48DRAFT_617616 [Phyllosticta citricarpa]
MPYLSICSLHSPHTPPDLASPLHEPRDAPRAPLLRNRPGAEILLLGWRDGGCRVAVEGDLVSGLFRSSRRWCWGGDGDGNGAVGWRWRRRVGVGVDVDVVPFLLRTLSIPVLLSLLWWMPPPPPPHLKSPRFAVEYDCPLSSSTTSITSTTIIIFFIQHSTLTTSLSGPVSILLSLSLILPACPRRPRKQRIQHLPASHERRAVPDRPDTRGLMQCREEE